MVKMVLSFLLFCKNEHKIRLFSINYIMKVKNINDEFKKFSKYLQKKKFNNFYGGAQKLKA